MLHYILVDNQLVPVSLLEWADWLKANNNRVVGKTIIGNADVSTVFVGFDYGKGDGAPLVFETHVLGGPLNGERAYAPTWSDAEAAHKAMCQRVEQAQL